MTIICVMVGKRVAFAAVTEIEKALLRICKVPPCRRMQERTGVLEILCHSSSIQSKRNDTCPSPSILTKHLKLSSPVRH